LEKLSPSNTIEKKVYFGKSSTKSQMICFSRVSHLCSEMSGGLSIQMRRWCVWTGIPIKVKPRDFFNAKGIAPMMRPLRRAKHTSQAPVALSHQGCIKSEVIPCLSQSSAYSCFLSSVVTPYKDIRINAVKANAPGGVYK